MTKNTKATVNKTHNLPKFYIATDKAISDAMTSTAADDGRCAKLIASLYDDASAYNLTRQMEGKFNASKTKLSRRAATVDFLSAQSPAFAERQAKLKNVKERKANEGKHDAIKAAKFAIEIKDYEKQIAAACQLAERAFDGVYYLKHKEARNVAVIGSRIEFTIPSSESGGSERPILRANQLCANGKDAWNAQTGNAKPKATKDAGTSLHADMKQHSRASAGVLADVIGSMPEAQADDMIADDNTIKLMATLMRRAFAHDGTIDINDVAAFIRDNVQGVRVEMKLDKSRAERKSA